MGSSVLRACSASSKPFQKSRYIGRRERMGLLLCLGCVRHAVPRLAAARDIQPLSHRPQQRQNNSRSGRYQSRAQTTFKWPPVHFVARSTWPQQKLEG